jgi:hypothetical protein
MNPIIIGVLAVVVIGLVIAGVLSTIISWSK